MLAKIGTVAFQGIEVVDIDVQVQMTSGALPSFTIVGLADKAVGESRERIRNALHAIGLALPPRKITVNLAPASMQKEGTHYDLPIALALLSAMGVIDPCHLEQFNAMGELALDGTVSPVPGILPGAFRTLNRDRKFICASASGPEAAWIMGLEIVAAPSLLALVNYFKGTQVISAPVVKKGIFPPFPLDFSEIKGQLFSKRAMEIAAAGGHNILLVGPPGAGKSMLAARLATILPALAPEEALEVSMIYSVAGLLPEGNLIYNRPFRDPHHSASLPSLIGGGLKARPGEISLAHKGVLFLDELPEFSRAALESLRQPLETRRAVVSRANCHISYPAQVQLVGAMNPCRCGYLADLERQCSKAPLCGRDYQAKISGPLLDRMDMHVSVPAVSLGDLQKLGPGEESSVIQKRVIKARKVQEDRFQSYSKTKGSPLSTSSGFLNALLGGRHLEEIVMADTEALDILNRATDKFKLSARSYYRLLKVARTIADLEENARVQRPHVAEALSYRQFGV